MTYLAAAAIVAAGVGSVAYALNATHGDSKPREQATNPSGSPSAAAAAAGCPVKPSQPAWAPPLHKGDAAAFVDDITLRDCTQVGTNQTVVKIWRIRNTGALYWRGYSLRRLGLPQKPDDCRTKNRVPINTTRPGDKVDIRVEITTPKKPGFCIARFKMLDSAGRVAFSGNRPVNFQLIVRDS
ncbi:NBR1-Ig-like domain-containing protein [Actinomadura oligospora]|uniref:NBR1-Ig-like domain-containing protein n=1 Tax=Actinomadura oligospora TaxID=111804 RepID=UPI0014749D70|nr:NBR1-Ig-like domain-containing protein [Actinomadura oligospora]